MSGVPKKPAANPAAGFSPIRENQFFRAIRVLFRIDPTRNSHHLRVATPVQGRVADVWLLYNFGDVARFGNESCLNVKLEAKGCKDLLA